MYPPPLESCWKSLQASKCITHKSPLIKSDSICQALWIHPASNIDVALGSSAGR